MKKALEREAIILDVLKTREKLSTIEATEMLNVSESSVRRIFSSLENSGQAARVYGGIKLANKNELNYSFVESEYKKLNEKRTIGLQASLLIDDRDIVYLDCGTTIQQLAIALKARLVNRELHDIRVITNSLINMQILNEYCLVVLVGGQYHDNRKNFSGFTTEKFIQMFKFNKSFVGADGFTLSDGFMSSDTETSRLNEIVISLSDKSYVLIDSSKIGRNSFVRYATSDEVEAVITDAKVSEEYKLQCSKQKFQLITSSIASLQCDE